MVVPAPLVSLSAKFGEVIARQMYAWSKGSEAKQLTDLLRREHPAAPRLLTQPDALAALWSYSTTGRFERERMLEAVSQVEHDPAAAAALTDAIATNQWRTKTAEKHVHFEVRSAVDELCRRFEETSALFRGALKVVAAQAPEELLVGRIGDALDLGVAPSVLRTGAPGDALHLPRDVDALIVERLTAALGGAGVQLVVVDGESLAGRSHAAAHALAQTARGLPLYAARTPAQLRGLLGAAPDEPAIVWLDPAEAAFDRAAGGVAEHELAATAARRHPLVLLAVADAADDRATPARRVARGSAVFVEGTLRPHEQKRLSQLRIDEQLASEIVRWGPGPALVASPAVVHAYRTRRSEPSCELVDAMLGWRALGMLQPLELTELQRLRLALVGERVDTDDAAALEGLLRDQAPAPGQLLLRALDDDGWGVHPALAQLLPPGRWREQWCRPAVAHVVGEWAEGDPGRLASWGVAVSRLGQPARARSIFDAAIALGSRRARFNLARLLFDAGDPAGALRALAQLRAEIERSSDPSPELWALLADAWLATGVLDQQAGDAGQAAHSYASAAALGQPGGLLNLAALALGDARVDHAFARLASDGFPPTAELAVARLLRDGSAEDPASTLLDELLEGMSIEEAERLGRLLERVGRFAQARRAFELASAGGRLLATAQLGGLLLHAGEPSAVAVLRQAVSRGSRAAQLYLGRALAADEPAQAREALYAAYVLGSPTAGVELLPLVAGADPTFASSLLVEIDPRVMVEHRAGWSDEHRRAVDALS